MQDDCLLDTETVRSVGADVRAALARGRPPEAAPEAVRPGCAEPLAADDRLPATFRLPAPEGAIGRRLLVRAAGTPLYRHLVWGLGRCYRGAREGKFSSARDAAPGPVAPRSLAAGDCNAPIPPRDSIDRACTTPAEPSVSIHLTNETGGRRPAHDPETAAARAIRSGYEYVPGEDP